MNEENIDTIEQLILLEKSDLHNHASRGGNIVDVIPNIDKIKNNLPSKFDGLFDMQKWYDLNIKVHCKGKEGYIKRIASAFKQASRNNVVKLCMSFGIGDSVFFEDLGHFINTIKELQKQYSPEIEFIPEIAFMREQSKQQVLEEFKSILKYDFFKSIDLFGDENLGVNDFIDVFKLAKEHNFILKAHIGEYCAPSLIIDAVDKLNLDQIQHGITAANSIEVMKYLKDKDIVLNVCPTSNVMLSFVDSIKSHPIKKLYRFGVKVTINTDDLLIFNSTIDEEYLKLYENNVLTLNELNNIRQIGIMVNCKKSVTSNRITSDL